MVIFESPIFLYIGAVLLTHRKYLLIIGKRYLRKLILSKKPIIYLVKMQIISLNDYLAYNFVEKKYDNQYI